MVTESDSGLIVVSRQDEIPEFRSEAEEADFWATHSYSDEVLAGFGPAPEWMDRLVPTERRRWISVDDRTLDRLTLLSSRRQESAATLALRLLSVQLDAEEARTG